MTAGVTAGRRAARRSQPAAVAEARELLVVLRHALLDGSPSGRAWTMPHMASATCSARSGVARARISSTSASSSRSIFSSALPSPSERGNGHARQVVLPGALRHCEAVAERDRIGHRRRECCRCGRPLSLLRVHTFLRLLSFLKPYTRGAVLSLVLAGLAMAATVAIPWLTGQAIDAIDGGDRDRLRELVLVIGGVALVRVGLSVARRLVAGRVSLGVEVDLRNLVYAHLQSLELGFFAGHADRPADVARDRRPPERALLPRLRARVHRPERARRSCSPRSRCWRCSRGSARSRSRPCRSWCSSRPATGAARGPRCRRSSSGSRS